MERAADGSECATADALWGPTMARYRRGHPQKTRMGLRPGRVVQGELEDPRDLHPFLVVRDGRLFVLDELRKGKPIYRHFASRDELANPPSLDGLPQSVAATIVDPSVRPRESTPASAATRARLIPGLLLAIVAISSAVALGLFAMQEATSTTSDESPAPSGVVRATLSVDHCPVPARPGLPVEHDLPRLLSGAPAQWGSPASEVERACGSLRPVPFASCAARFVDVRATAWGPTLDIPSRRETQLAFHPTRGLFEVMVWSDADAEALAAAVEQRLGAPHRTDRRHRFWSYPAGDDAPTTRLKVSPLPDGHARGRSAIRLHYPATADAYAADMRAAGCRR